jgi:3-oxoacid CoA-transferase A subunit
LDKVFATEDEAVADIPDGASIAIGGFFTAGTPVPLIRALVRQGAKDLTIVCMTMGPGNEEILQLVVEKRIRKAICSYPLYRSASRGAQCAFEQAARKNELELEVYPMGTFVEKLRAGGAGIGGFYTQAGVGTVVEKGKEKKTIGGREYLLELALIPDYALVYASIGDRMGNLSCRKTAMNFNPSMAAAAKTTIAAAEKVVNTGELSSDLVHIPGIYVQRVVEVRRPNYYPSID